MFLWRRNKLGESSSPIDLLGSLAAKDPQNCCLREGLDYVQISEISRVVRTEIPEDLCQFLLFTNGASLYRGACSIFGRHIGDGPYEIGDICESTIWYRDHGALGPNQLVFGQRSGGGIFVVLPEPEKGAFEYRVLYPGEDQVEEIFHSLAAWLYAELEFWRELENELSPVKTPSA